MSHNGVLSDSSWAEGRLCKTKTRIAKTSVTAEVCHYTQVSKSDPMLRNSPLFKACWEGGKNDKKKVPCKNYFKLLYLDCKYNAYVYKSKDTKKVFDF